MEYYGNNDFRDYRNGSYLAHYGRKGMKKGKHLPGTTWWKDLVPGANGQLDPQQVKVAQAQAMYAQQRMQNARANEATARNAAAIRDQREKEGRNAEVNARNEALAAKKDKEAIQSRQDAYGKMAMSQNKAEEDAKKAEKKEKEEKEHKETEKKIDDIVEKVINGNYGNGEARKKALAKEGYDYAEIQNKVNEKLGSSVRHETEKSKESTETKTESKTEASSTKSSNKTMSGKERAGRTAEAAIRSGTKEKADAKKKQIQDRANEATARAKQERKRQKKQKKASAKRVKRVKKKAADISAKNERYARIGKNQVVLEPDKKNYMLKT